MAVEPTPEAADTRSVRAAPDTGDGASAAQRAPKGTGAPRKRGRPKGTPKTGGRRAGVKNWSHPEIRDALLGRSGAIEVLADICAGKQQLVSGPTGKAAWIYPTMSERLRALDLVLRKVVPDLQATALSGPDGAPLFPNGPPADPLDVARAVLSVLRTAAPDSHVAVTAPGEFAAKFRDPDLARRFDASGQAEPAAEPAEPATPSAGGIACGERGASITPVRTMEGREKWAVTDGWGQVHAFKADREAAEAFAATLPGPAHDGGNDA